ncbi:MAG TPA: HNH endonuclease signature motif containing protein [Nitrososphaerales archaeon]|nr:HNH endonuclease signature motif containing protein [Nitrososphaerales archaeon]
MHNKPANLSINLILYRAKNINAKICRTDRLAPVRERFTVDGEKLSQFNEGRLQAHIDNRCAFCQKDLSDFRKIYCNSKCRRLFKIKYKYITNSWASTRWRALRRDHFLCVLCMKEGRRSWTREVDHIVEIADGGSEFDLANTQTICKSHHRKKTAESRRLRALKKGAVVGIVKSPPRSSSSP